MELFGLNLSLEFDWAWYLSSLKNEWVKMSQYWDKVDPVFKICVLLLVLYCILHCTNIHLMKCTQDLSLTIIRIIWFEFVLWIWLSLIPEHLDPVFKSCVLLLVLYCILQCTNIHLMKWNKKWHSGRMGLLSVFNCTLPLPLPSNCHSDKYINHTLNRFSSNYTHFKNYNI